jgi:KDO2-lipid IV(A) lauroyltransferase
MTKVLHMLFVAPLSRMPYVVLYGLADFVAALLWISGYRKKVVQANVDRVFPAKSASWRRDVVRGFYRHLTSVMVESVRNFRASERELLERMHHLNPEVLLPFADLPQGVLLACGHYGNWERYAVTSGRALPMPVMGVYKRLSNDFYEKKMLETRGRMGLELVKTGDVKAWMQNTGGEGRSVRGAVILAVDQRPTDPRKGWWTQWLGQETPIHYGLEIYARKHNMPVCFFGLHPVKGKPRGYWEVRYEMITDVPRDWPEGALLQAANARIEAQIKADPKYWLWSHKRWKHQRPADMTLHAPLNFVEKGNV